MNWPWKRKTVVLGAELAAARKAEEERLAAGVTGPSPLPDEKYDFERGDYDFVSVTSLPLDLKLRAFLNRIREISSEEQIEVRRRLSFDDQYTLIHFIKRCSVLALNESPVEWCLAALTAFSIIDEPRVDWRDVRWAAGLLEHTILKTPGVKATLVNLTVGLPRSTLALLDNISETSRLREWGYAEIKTSNGIGLIQQGFAEYKPTVDLTGMALQISGNLTQGRYVGHVEIATKIPDIWFSRSEREKVHSRLEKARGVAAINGSLRPQYGLNYNQMFVEWIAEMPTSDDCVYLSKAVGSGTPLDGRYAVGVSVGSLFALLIAGSIKEGVVPYENIESLKELSEQTRQILKTNFQETDESFVNRSGFNQRS